MKRVLGATAIAATLVGSLAGPTVADTPADPRTAASDAITAFVASFGDRLTELAPGTAADATAPTADLASGHSSVATDDPSLTTTKWWTVPVSLATLKGDLEAGDDGDAMTFPASTSGTDGTVVLSSSDAGESTADHTAPTLLVELESTADGGTAVRVDGFIAARDPRPAGTSITGKVASVDVTSSITTTGSTGSESSQTFAGGSAEASAIVQALNALPGVPVTEGTMPPPPCPEQPTQATVQIAVHTADGDTTVTSQTAASCVSVPTATLTQGSTSTTLDATAFQQEFPSFFGQAVTAPAATTTAANTAAAAVESSSLFDAVGTDLAGAGATADSTAPTTYLQTAPGSPGGFGDPTLTHSGWWIVPLSLDDTAAYLHDHVPAGMTDDGLGQFSVADHGVVTDSGDEETYTGPSTDAYGPGEVDLVMEAVDATHTGVRVDTYISQRAGRPATSFVTGTVDKIHVAVTVNSLVPGKSGLKHQHAAGSFTLTGPVVDRLVNELNGLPGPELHPGVVFRPLCLLVGAPVYHATLTFPGDAGAPTVRLRDVPCGGTYATVLQGGKRQGPRLDAGSFYGNIEAWVKRIG